MFRGAECLMCPVAEMVKEKLPLVFLYMTHARLYTCTQMHIPPTHPPPAINQLSILFGGSRHPKHCY